MVSAVLAEGDVCNKKIWIVLSLLYKVIFKHQLSVIILWQYCALLNVRYCLTFGRTFVLPSNYQMYYNDIIK